MYNEMKLSAGAEYAIAKLEAAGFRADVVGGCVRDSLLGIAPSDFDITTSAMPSEMKSVFFADRVLETGLKHGTLTLLVDGEPLEITTYRIDGEYDDARHPRQVEFSRDIENDLSRRDFTVNAMAYSPKHGYTDLFCGKDDLRAKVIRAVGDPEMRFKEDALRILRALRFASTLDFEIEEKTSAALCKLSDNLSLISAERVYAELMKLIAGKGALGILERYRNVIEKIIPEASGYKPVAPDKFKEATPVLRFSSLFVGKTSEEIDCAMHRLRSDNETRLLVIDLVQYSNLSMGTRVEARKAIALLGEKTARLLASFRNMLLLNSENEIELISDIINSGECYKLSSLAVGGGDIMSLGARGPLVGKILSDLLSAVIEERIENSREELLGYAVKLLK